MPGGEFYIKTITFEDPEAAGQKSKYSLFRYEHAKKQAPSYRENVRLLLRPIGPVVRHTPPPQAPDDLTERAIMLPEGWVVAGDMCFAVADIYQFRASFENGGKGFVTEINGFAVKGNEALLYGADLAEKTRLHP